jgi:outer membrane biosynthesis protein TonB
VLWQSSTSHNNKKQPQVIDADIEACNGIIHIIDKVILPEDIEDWVSGGTDIKEPTPSPTDPEDEEPTPAPMEEKDPTAEPTETEDEEPTPAPMEEKDPTAEPTETEDEEPTEAPTDTEDKDPTAEPTTCQTIGTFHEKYSKDQLERRTYTKHRQDTLLTPHVLLFRLV